MAKRQSSPQSSTGRCNTPGKEFTTPAYPDKFKDRKPGTGEPMPPTEQAPIRMHQRMAGS